MFVCMYSHMRIMHTCGCVHARTCTWMHKHTHAHTHTHMHTRTYANAHTYITCTCIYMHVHTYTHDDTDARARMQKKHTNHHLHSSSTLTHMCMHAYTQINDAVREIKNCAGIVCVRVQAACRRGDACVRTARDTVTTC
jgi:hypothetical protein